VLGTTGLSRTALRRYVTGRLAEGLGWADVRASIRAVGAEPAAYGWIETEVGAMHRLAVDLMAWGDADYPALLEEIPDPPLALFLRGERAALEMTGIAVVGARKCTPAAQNLAFQLGRDLAAAGIAVVSGLALGIDGAAHRGALDAGGITLALLGAGHAHVYPRHHRGLAEAIVSSGAVLTEYPPGTGPRKHHFPERNRLISGLGRAVVLIEAGARSGSLITARLALEQGRDVMAVPGSPATGRSAGCHRLIQAGATLVEGASDVFGQLGIHVAPPRQRGLRLDPWLARVLARVTEEFTSLDDLVDQLDLPTERVLEALVHLELGGFVDRVDGGYIRRPR